MKAGRARNRGFNARCLALATAALGLGTWSVIHLVRDLGSGAAFSDASLPGPGRDLKPGTGWTSSQGGVSRARPARDLPDGMLEGRPAPRAEDLLRAYEEGREGSASTGGLQAGSDGEFPVLLDRVFAEDRLRQEPAGREAGGGRGPSPRGALPVGAVTKEARSRHLAGTENAYYDAFMELAKADPGALAGTVDTVLAGAGEDCRKVAALRALYDTGSGTAPEVFTSAISSLPRAANGGGVSVPAFAVAFLCKRVPSDARAREILERVALAEPWRTAPEMRRQAAATLLAYATPYDLQRYNAYPPYSEGGAALADGALALASANAGEE